MIDALASLEAVDLAVAVEADINDALLGVA
jgi:hypothetical protein